MVQNVHEAGAAALNRGDIPAFVRLYHPDAVVHDPQYSEPLVGRERIEQDIVALVRAVPDLRITIRTVLQHAADSASQYTISGTQTGPLIGPEGEIPPSGEAIEANASVFSRLDQDGLVVEEHRYYDVLTLFPQVGAVA